VQGPNEPNEPNQLAGLTRPTDPSRPIGLARPTELARPTDLSRPTELARPTDLARPADPPEPTQPRPESAAAEPCWLLLRATLVRDRALDWELVLFAVGIGRRLEPLGEKAAWRLSVAPEDAARAEEALRSFDLENAETDEARAEPEGYGFSWAGVLVAALLVVFQLRTGPRDDSSLWFLLGSADAEKIVQGQWWRAFTALTLHADLGHALGNASVGALFWTLLARRLGPALSSWAVLAAAVAGNLITAHLARSHFVSVGASTAVFAALGAVALLEAAAGAGRRAFLAAGSGVALLGFLGTGKEADLLAHLFGFLCGAGAGLLLAQLVPRAPRRSLLQPVVASLALVALGAAWFRALH